jgi:hypothetical protein
MRVEFYSAADATMGKLLEALPLPPPDPLD